MPCTATPFGGSMGPVTGVAGAPSHSSESPAPDSLLWAHDPSTGFLRSLSPSASSAVGGRCLTAVGPVESNDVAVAVHVSGEEDDTESSSASEDRGSKDKSMGSSGGGGRSTRDDSVWRSVLIRAACGGSLRLAVGVATERDLKDGWDFTSNHHEGEKQVRAPSPLAMASRLARDLLQEEVTGSSDGPQDGQRDKEDSSSTEGGLSPSGRNQKQQGSGEHLGLHSDYNDNRRYRRYVEAMAAHTSWWAEWWERGWVDLGGEVSDSEWAQLERFYVMMLYLMRGSMREGAVAPALWGPFSTTDTPQVVIYELLNP